MRMIDRTIAVHADAEYATLRDRRFVAILFGDPLEYCFDLLGSLEGLTVLEIGCGNGALSVACALGGANVLGLDIGQADLTRARDLAQRWDVAGNCRFIGSRAEAMAVRDAAVDVVLSRSTLQYLERSHLPAELVRVLRPGGRVVLIENLAHNPFIRLYRRRRARRAASAGELAYLASIRGYLAPADLAVWRGRFTRVHCRGFHLLRMFTILPVVRRPTARAWRSLDACVAHLDALLLRSLPGLWRFAWFLAIVLHDDRGAPRDGMGSRR